jgi:hypothetical protein
MADTESRQGDWSSAEMRDGALTVEQGGEAAKDWSRHPNAAATFRAFAEPDA